MQRETRDMKSSFRIAGSGKIGTLRNTSVAAKTRHVVDSNPITEAFMLPLIPNVRIAPLIRADDELSCSMSIQEPIPACTGQNLVHCGVVEHCQQSS